ncbi:MAG: hypothetical protein J5X23_15385 [Candidatus Accumulibacter sp.]|uniref:hypothetical protein n=1 Tax=Accumulibacter sp. TaxID=2053492 RepID=UPI0005A17783|nr:hypothetical protein [Accumulibacter sp.]MBO3716325.1 hypothetical protein [Accumulibacter sp.]
MPVTGKRLPGELSRRRCGAATTHTPGAFEFGQAPRGTHHRKQRLVHRQRQVHAGVFRHPLPIELRAKRKPTSWLALSGAFALRFAERTFLASLFQEPPRSARSDTLLALLAIGTVHDIHYRRSGKHEWVNPATPPLAAPAHAWRNDGGAVV